MYDENDDNVLSQKLTNVKRKNSFTRAKIWFRYAHDRLFSSAKSFTAIFLETLHVFSFTDVVAPPNINERTKIRRLFHLRYNIKSSQFSSYIYNISMPTYNHTYTTHIEHMIYITAELNIYPDESI